jgi:hypothetical protein
MTANIKFLMDAQVPLAITRGLRTRGVEVVTVQEVGLAEAADIQILAWAGEQGYVLFTQDSDFLALHHQGLSHHGLVYGHQQMPIGQVVRGLMLIYEVLAAAEIQSRVEFL